MTRELTSFIYEVTRTIHGIGESGGHGREGVILLKEGFAKKLRTPPRKEGHLETKSKSFFYIKKHVCKVTRFFLFAKIKY